MNKRPKVELIRQPTLFQMEKLEKGAEPASQLNVERPYSLPGILLGTSAFTANGWQGSFYPSGMKSRDFLPTTPRSLLRSKWTRPFTDVLPRTRSTTGPLGLQRTSFSPSKFRRSKAQFVKEYESGGEWRDTHPGLLDRPSMF